jgi:OOP family OmpA-OmpF porin
MQWFALILASLVSSAQLSGSASGTYMVFFDWGKPDLNRDAEATLEEVATVYVQTRPSRVLVIGHSDRSGPGAANLRASRRRAEAVRDHLADRGVPRVVMTVEALGESQPIVATEDGVREGQNRRVEIVFR